jgi:N-glycosylase/DNA lyase
MAPPMFDCVRQHLFPVRDYDLAATLISGQAFRWHERGGWWEGIVGPQWARLKQTDDGILAEAVEHRASKVENRNAAAFDSRLTALDPTWRSFARYLQIDIDLASVLLSFPDDEPMRAAVTACRGLRLLRQEPWECLASFILSSTKQIVQIQQIVVLLCERFGESVVVPSGHQPVFAFPTAERLAACAESELRGCKMGFRAPNLLRTAQMIAGGEIDLQTLHTRAVEEARSELLKLPGVGNKIANCVLLFAYGFQQAFPVDVWVMKALRQLYFPKRRVSAQRLARFTATHFGPNAGYAQQYLFHYMRMKDLKARSRRSAAMLLS